MAMRTVYRSAARCLQTCACTCFNSHRSCTRSNPGSPWSRWPSRAASPPRTTSCTRMWWTLAVWGWWWWWWWSWSSVVMLWLLPLLSWSTSTSAVPVAGGGGCELSWGASSLRHPNSLCGCRRLRSCRWLWRLGSVFCCCCRSVGLVCCRGGPWSGKISRKALLG